MGRRDRLCPPEIIERVSHLVLFGSYMQGRRRAGHDLPRAALADVRAELARHGWGSPDPQYRQLFLSRFLPEGTQEEWRLRRAAATVDLAENAARFLETFDTIDVADLAPRPTLIACGRREPENLFEQSRLMATLIPGSRLLPLDSGNHLLPEARHGLVGVRRELHAFLAA